MTTQELAALTGVLNIVYMVGNNVNNYAVGTEVVNALDKFFGDWKCHDIKTTLPFYHVRNNYFFSEFLDGLALDLDKQVTEHTETTSDIAPATIKNYTTEPEHKETVKRAPFDSTTTKIDSEVTTVTNNGTEYQNNKAVTEYDTTKADGHTSKVISDKSGTNYPISKILTEEQSRRFSDLLYNYLFGYVREYGYRVEVI